MLYEVITTYLHNMNQVTEEMTGIVKKGMEDIKYLSDKTEDNNTAGMEIQQVIMKTDSSAKKIGNASSVIASIADQTNLLALNAAIEAASRITSYNVCYTKLLREYTAVPYKIAPMEFFHPETVKMECSEWNAAFKHSINKTHNGCFIIVCCKGCG